MTREKKKRTPSSGALLSDVVCVCVCHMTSHPARYTNNRQLEPLAFFIFYFFPPRLRNQTAKGILLRAGRTKTLLAMKEVTPFEALLPISFRLISPR